MDWIEVTARLEGARWEVLVGWKGALTRSTLREVGGSVIRSTYALKCAPNINNSDVPWLKELLFRPWPRGTPS